MALRRDPFTMIVYGLDLLTPKLFLPVGCILCAIVGMACGSSWTTTATIGLAFLGIGAGLGIPAPITAGMIISGAYVGDKFSPLSDTTNLAAAVAETGLFDHVTAMVSTTGPTLLLSLILYTILGLNVDTSAYDATVAEGIQEAFRGAFTISPILLLPIIVVIVMCILRVPGLVGIAISVATATHLHDDLPVHRHFLRLPRPGRHLQHAAQRYRRLRPATTVADSILGKAERYERHHVDHQPHPPRARLRRCSGALRLRRASVRRPEAQDPLCRQPHPRDPADLHLLRRHHVRPVPRHRRSRPHLC